MENSEGRSSIARSVPAHGLNGGVFPLCPTSSLATNGLILPHSNGTAGHTNGTVSPGTDAVVNGNGTAMHITGTVAHTNGMVNGGLAPSPASDGKGYFTNGTNNGTFTSSNGYYGFQPTSVTGQQNGLGNGAVSDHSVGQSEDVDMETDTDPPSECYNGMNGTHTNGVSTTNGIHTVPQNHTNGTSLAFTNGQVARPFLGFTNGHTETNGLKKDNAACNRVVNGQSLLGEDITLNPGVSHNYIPVGGRKRSREEVYVPEMKRMRTEGKSNIQFKFCK